jgi:hypothetical protein
MDSIQSATATQRFSTASVQAVLPTKPESVDAETEYGCVDWYPYVTVLDRPAEWADADGRLANTAS